MPARSSERSLRMMLELPSEAQMAIKIRAAKSNMSTGSVVCEAVQKAFGADIREAKVALAEIAKMPN